MVATTPIAGLRYAQQADAANAETAFHNLATDLDNKIIPTFATTAARDTAIPSPTEGQFCYVTSTAAGGRVLQGYKNSAWRNYYEGPLFAYKTALESVTSSTTLQNDDHLFLSVEANTTYRIEIFMQVAGDTGGDIKVNWTWPTGTSFAYGTMGLVSTATGTSGSVDLTAFGGQDSTSPGDGATRGISGSGSFLMTFGLLVVGSTAGTFQVQWAQGTSSGSATLVTAGSYITAHRVA